MAQISFSTSFGVLKIGMHIVKTFYTGYGSIFFIAHILFDFFKCLKRVVSVLSSPELDFFIYV